MSLANRSPRRRMLLASDRADRSRELAAILIEETAHRDALLEGLKRLVLQGVQGTTQDDPDTSA